ncbi:MAG: alpha/beta fold hydrolase [Pseudomonadota bacterium]
MDGCLIIHGLTGTPATVASLRDGLLKAGFSVSVPYLAGHGSTLEDLARATREEWYDTVRIAFDAMRREVDRVFCAGISLGSLLAMKLALDEGWGVRALALLATPLKLSFMESIAVPAVRYSPLRWMLRAVPKDIKRSVADPEGQKRYNELSLPMIPTNSVFEISDLQRELLSSIGRITNPILLVHGKHDTVAPPKNIDIVKNKVKSDIVQSIILPNSRHVITMDYDRADVARAVVNFFKNFA